MSDPDKLLKSLGKVIDDFRKEKGLSFRELALRSEMEKSNLVKLTSKGRNITISTLYKISKGLEVSVHEIVKRIDG